MTEPQTCPTCNQPVDPNEAHIVGGNGHHYHVECYDKDADIPAAE